MAATLIQQSPQSPSFGIVHFQLIECSISSVNGGNGRKERIMMMMTFLPLFLSPNYPLMCDKTRKNGSSLHAGAFHNDKIILSQPPVLWMGIIMFCPKHLRFSCPDLQSKWVQLMTITLQVSQHRHELIESYLGGERACPPSKYVMITAVTQWGWRETQMLPGQSICVCISTALTSPDKPEWMDLGFPCGPRREELNGLLIKRWWGQMFI